jgi:predicted CXXCH cytochrome family protein
MKKQLFVLTALAGLALGASIAHAGSGFGSGIVGSKHDMNLQTGNGATADSKGRVCAFCHTPHHKLDASKLDYNPLWSHDINNEDFVAYGEKSVSFDATMGADPLTGPSRLCMSCHDGRIAVDQHYGMSGTAAGDHLKGDDFGQIAVGLGNDLSNDHPIGFGIEDALATDGTKNGMPVFGHALNANLVAPANATKLNGKPMTDLGFKGLVTGKSIFTCASCHEVHNKDSVEEAFLYEKQAGSQFCLMCHNK